MGRDNFAAAFHSPASFIEARAFHPKDQPENLYLKHTVARIVAITSPIFYAFQFFWHLVWGIIHLPTDLIIHKRISVLSDAFYNTRNFLSSILEIPHKLITGPSNAPNYFGSGYRYQCISLDPVYVSMKGTEQALKPLPRPSLYDLPPSWGRTELLRRARERGEVGGKLG